MKYENYINYRLPYLYLVKEAAGYGNYGYRNNKFYYGDTEYDDDATLRRDMFNAGRWADTGKHDIHYSLDGGKTFLTAKGDAAMARAMQARNMSTYGDSYSKWLASQNGGAGAAAGGAAPAEKAQPADPMTSYGIDGLGRGITRSVVNARRAARAEAAAPPAADPSAAPAADPSAAPTPAPAAAPAADPAAAPAADPAAAGAAPAPAAAPPVAKAKPVRKKKPVAAPPAPGTPPAAPGTPPAAPGTPPAAPAAAPGAAPAPGRAVRPAPVAPKRPAKAMYGARSGYYGVDKINALSDDQIADMYTDPRRPRLSAAAERAFQARVNSKEFLDKWSMLNAAFMRKLYSYLKIKSGAYRR